MIARMSPFRVALTTGVLLTALGNAAADETIDVKSLLEEMVDFENLAQKPEPFFKQAMASSTSRESHKGGDAWFHNLDRGHYVRTETNRGRKEHVLADLKGPGVVTRFWSANPTKTNVTRFYFDGETVARFELPLEELFKGKTPPLGPDFSYISGTGGNLYYPIPYADSLEITIEEGDEPLSLYYEIGYRTYQAGTPVETFDPEEAGGWEDVQMQVAQALARPDSAPAPEGSQWISRRLTIPPGETRGLPTVQGEKAVFKRLDRKNEKEDSHETPVYPCDSPRDCRSHIRDHRFVPM